MGLDWNDQVELKEGNRRKTLRYILSKYFGEYYLRDLYLSLGLKQNKATKTLLGRRWKAAWYQSEMKRQLLAGTYSSTATLSLPGCYGHFLLRPVLPALQPCL